MHRALLISVRFHDGRYHGAGDWPPSPARLFQALVAGAACGQTLAETDKSTFAWLELLDPPVIAAPTKRPGPPYKSFVPNNDLDSVGGDLRRIGEIRAPKQTRPILFEAETPLLYFWSFEDSPEAQAVARRVCAIAERLYQLGRGVDMAWAWGEIISAEEAEARLAAYPGAIHRPNNTGEGRPLAVPVGGSLISLVERHRRMRERFRALYEDDRRSRRGERKAVGQVFVQPPKPRFGQVVYDSPPVRLLFDLRASGKQDTEPGFAPWPLDRAVELVTAVRDRAASHLKRHLREKEALIERVLIGRGATEVDKTARVRIVPLPSIGHAHADHMIRRVLVEIPPNCPITSGDLEWGFSGLNLGADYQSGEITDKNGPVLTAASDRGMLGHYGIQPALPARVWRTVTPAALPRSAARRRIDPARLRDPAERKGACERSAEQSRAAAAAIQALRHAGVRADAAEIRVQREPFSGNGEAAASFTPGTRFPKERLWHVEISFAHPVKGPLIIGDGRYLGLGLMQPVADADLVVFRLAAEPRVAVADRSAWLNAVRRALMSLSRRNDGSVPRLFSGHEVDGAPARSGRHEHVFLSAADCDGDGYLDRLIVAAPWRCDRSVRPLRDDAAVFDHVVSSLERVRAGRLGIISVILDGAGAEDGRLVGPSRGWESHACYRPTRPLRRGDGAADMVLRDVTGECVRRGLPRPNVQLLEYTVGSENHVTARLRLHFAVAIRGPLMLGRDSHCGGGLFVSGNEN